MKRQLNTRKIFAILLMLTMVFQTIYGIELIKDTSNPNIYRMVGLGYYDCWKTSGGVWQGGIAPNSTHTLPFTFPLGPDKIPRNIKKVTVRKVNMLSGSDQKIWNASRIKDDSFQNRKNQSVTSYSVINYSPTGAVDSRNVTIEVQATVTLTAPNPMQLPTGGMAAGVEGRRYYVPLMIEIELYPDVKNVTVQHFNANTGQRLAENEEKQVAPNTSFSASAKSFPPAEFLNIKISYDKGVSWAETLTTSSVTKTITKDTIIRFYYGKPPDTNINAALKLSANPPNVEKGKTANVTLTLDGSQSTSKSDITKYEFWISEEEGEFKTAPDFTGTKSVQSSVKSNVASGTTYYVKLKVTDSKNKTSEVIEQVTINEFVPVQQATAEAKLQMMAVKNTPRLIDFREDYWSGLDKYDYYMDVWAPDYWKDSNGKYKPMDLDFILDASSSSSTNGISSYKFIYTNANQVLYEGPSSTFLFNQTLIVGPQEIVDGRYRNEYDLDFNMAFKVIITDSGDKGVTSEKEVTLMYKYFFEEQSTTPTVKLTADKEEYLRQQTATFTTTYSSAEEILKKDWSIEGINSTYKDNGTGDIPSKYSLDVPTGEYRATQTIYYADEEGETASSYSSVNFIVAPLHKPQVFLKTPSDKYVMPVTVPFTSTYVENSETYPIDKKYWAIEIKEGRDYTRVTEGDGNVPDTFIDFNWQGGTYKALQFIEWTEYGEVFQAVAEVTFKIIDPRPVADFKVEMKTSTTPTWSRVDTSSGSGKQYRQIRIDLSPAAAVQDSDNPYPIQFTNPDTQIQIVPLNSTTTSDLTKNNTVKFINNNHYTLQDGVITISAKEYIDVRFDDYGTYRIRVRVSNGVYTSAWIARDIIISEDKPPVVTMSIEDTIGNKATTIFRDSNDLHARYNVKLNILAGDDDIPDIANLKLKFLYDYNANGTPTDDGVHSQMYVTKSINYLQPYMSVTKSPTMDSFQIDMSSSDFAALGKVRHDIVLGEVPTIPYFEVSGSDLPAIPKIEFRTTDVGAELRTLLIDNRAGNVTVEIGKESAIEITIILGTSTMHVNTDTLRAYYGENAKIYVVDENGKRSLIS